MHYDLYTQGVHNLSWNLRAIYSKNYTAELYENWVMAEWNDSNFIEGEKTMRLKECKSLFCLKMYVTVGFLKMRRASKIYKTCNWKYICEEKKSVHLVKKKFSIIESETFTGICTLKSI